MEEKKMRRKVCCFSLRSSCAFIILFFISECSGRNETFTGVFTLNMKCDGEKFIIWEREKLRSIIFFMYRKLKTASEKNFSSFVCLGIMRSKLLQFVFVFSFWSVIWLIDVAFAEVFKFITGEEGRLLGRTVIWISEKLAFQCLHFNFHYLSCMRYRQTMKNRGIFFYFLYLTFKAQKVVLASEKFRLCFKFQGMIAKLTSFRYIHI